MPEFFVWSTPKLIRLIDAEDEQRADEVFLDQPASSEPVSGEPPASFVQATAAFRLRAWMGDTAEYWVADEERSA